MLRDSKKKKGTETDSCNNPENRKHTDCSLALREDLSKHNITRASWWFALSLRKHLPEKAAQRRTGKPAAASRGEIQSPENLAREGLKTETVCSIDNE